MKKALVCLISLSLLFLSHPGAIAQEDLLQKLNSATGEEKCDLLNELSLYVVNNDPAEAREYARQAYDLSKELNYKKGSGFALYNLGNVNYYLDEYEEGIENLDEAERIFKEISDESGLGYVANTLGEIHTLTGRYGEALPALFDALSHFQKAEDEVGLARVNNNIGLIHYYQRNYDEALEYFNQALLTADETRIGDASLYIGRVYIDQDNYSEAQKYLEKALAIGEKNEDNYIISDCKYLLGRIDAFYGETDQALEKFLSAIELKIELEDGQGIALCSIHIGNLYLSRKDATKAKEYFYKARSIALDIGVKEELKEANLGLSNSYHFLSQHDSAYFYLNEHNKIQHELLSEEASKKLAELQASLAAQKREAEIEAEKKLEAFSKKVMIGSGIAIILVLIVFAFIMYNRYRMKQKANEQLAKFNSEIKLQRDIIEEKNRDILDSIKYAKRIQEAILPTTEILNRSLNEHFVFYRPKDIVSGDFYWALDVESSGSKKSLFAVVDCTGHGVPGAFVSIVGYNGLNRAVKEYGLTEPAAILDKLNLLVEETFRQQGNNSIKDGMDITLCSMEIVNDKVVTKFAAANNPLWIIRNDGSCDEFKADKQPIGAYIDRKPFTQHEITVSQGDTLYLFSDGFADQFGGEKGKKYKYARMKEFFISIHRRSVGEQRELLNSEIESWMNDNEQLDDMCIIGVKI